MINKGNHLFMWIRRGSNSELAGSKKSIYVFGLQSSQYPDQLHLASSSGGYRGCLKAVQHLTVISGFSHIPADFNR
jgi:hypothetical protein